MEELHQHQHQHQHQNENHKTKEMRLKESIEILTKLKDLGISSSLPSYIQVKEQLDKWIKTGEYWDGRIEFPTYGRYADIVLPVRKTTSPTFAFKVHHHMKKKLEQQLQKSST